MFELIINILLFIFLGFTFFTHVLEAAVPASVARNPYALQPDVWPKTIIILLEICLIVNIIKIIKKNKGNPDFTLGAFVGSIPGFLMQGKRVLMVGDRNDDMRGAADCGLDAAGALYGYGSREELEPFGPVLLAESCEELTDKLLACRANG